MESTKVGIREFRENLSRFLESSEPVAITRHGETVGFYIPVRKRRTDAEREALRAAATKLDALIAASGASEDELVKEFREERRHRKRKAS
jgi:antitoxin (DNA-binding transcriptional repressor) of toxin-antitoxin stability system